MYARPLITSAVLVAALLMLFVSPVGAEAQIPMDASAETGSLVGFTVYGRVLFPVKREGHFNDFAGELSYDPANPAGTHVDITVYTASVDVNNADQNALLRSDKFFDVDRFPTMHFTSIAATPQHDGTLTVSGDLTIRGITKRVSTPVTVQAAGGKSILETTFQIDRTDFGINGIPGWGGFKVSIAKKVEIHIAIASGQTGPPMR
jgi:polyisoprenoid-binding protein YceI